MSELKDFLVPVEPAIKEFKEHLNCHPRTILSARYGDGKSYFIDAFIKDSDVQKNFQFIKIYPVNYQVLDNNDIFDVIKYDILLQMGLQGMIEERYNVSSRDAFFYCMKNHGLGILDKLINIAGAIEGLPLLKTIGTFKNSCTELVGEINKAVKEYQRFKKGETEILDKYVAEIDTITIYEDDLITKIIQENLNSWREKNKKKIVLLFEDMDRIDPSQLFRILNVFSAHMDYAYKYGVTPRDTLYGNKFGFDNVVIVIHYENLRSIFSHFYGSGACFDGYINKFADKGRFDYSLKEETAKHYYGSLSKISHLPEETLHLIITDDKIQQCTLRELANSLDTVEKQRKPIAGVTYDIAIVMAVMRRLGISDTEIINTIRQVFEKDIETWLKYLYPNLKHLNRLEDGGLKIIDNEGHWKTYIFEETSGEVNVHSESYPISGRKIKLGQIIKDVLTLVSK